MAQDEQGSGSTTRTSTTTTSTTRTTKRGSKAGYQSPNVKHGPDKFNNTAVSHQTLGQQNSANQFSQSITKLFEQIATLQSAQEQSLNETRNVVNDHTKDLKGLHTAVDQNHARILEEHEHIEAVDKATAKAFAELQGDTQEIENHVKTVEEAVTRQGKDHGGRIKTVETTVESHKTQIADHGAKLKNLEPRVKHNETQISNHGQRLGSLETEVAKKADKTEVAKKADKTEVDKKADRTEVAKKADKTEVDKKADRTEVAKKADRTEVDKKADKTEVAKKADKTEVDKKADKAEVKSVTDELAKTIKEMNALLTSTRQELENLKQDFAQYKKQAPNEIRTKILQDLQRNLRFTAEVQVLDDKQTVYEKKVENLTSSSERVSETVNTAKGVADHANNVGGFSSSYKRTVTSHKY